MEKKVVLVACTAVMCVAAIAGVPVFEEGNVQTRCGGVPVKEYGEFLGRHP